MKRLWVAMVSFLVVAGLGTGVASAGAVTCERDGANVFINGTPEQDVIIVRESPDVPGLGEVLVQADDGSLQAICEFPIEAVTFIQAFLGDGNDFIDLQEAEPPDRPTGIDIDSELNGEGGDDQIDGGGGSDLIRGGRGNDVLKGGPGNDEVNGGKGDDSLQGNTGQDEINGGSGNDRIRSVDGEADAVRGGTGDADRARVDDVDTVRNVENVTEV
jgi:Ca2+-binding RTX toxin-like protein